METCVQRRNSKKFGGRENEPKREGDAGEEESRK